MAAKIRVTVWNEYRHERSNEVVANIYPEGIHGYIASFLNADGGFEVRTATLDEPEHGLTQEVLDNTDVLIWWGHKAHAEVSDEIAERVRGRILGGMGLVALHSAHASKVFRSLCGTGTRLRWRDDPGDRERIWLIEPGHPIAEGLPSYIEVEKDEMYGENFQIARPDELVFITWFEGGEVLRSGCCYYRERGKIFYFQPGHETFPVYHVPEIQRVIRNAIRWAKPSGGPALVIGKQEVSPEELYRRSK